MSNQIITEDFLSCPICFEDYFSETKSPICTDCGHTVCRECLESILSTSKKCPFCSKSLLGPLSSYPVNYAYKTMVSDYKERKERESRRLSSFLTQMKECEFKEGYYQGQLVVVYKNKEKVSIRHGKGKIIYNNGDAYNGDWVNGEKSGNGVYQFSNGSVYEGEFSSDMMEGEGRIDYERQEGKGIKSYKGTFRRGKYNGQGVIEYFDGTRLESIFHYGEVVDCGVSKYIVGDRIFIGKINVSIKKNFKEVDTSSIGLVYNKKTGETRQFYFNNDLIELQHPEDSQLIVDINNKNKTNTLTSYFPLGDIFKGIFDVKKGLFFRLEGKGRKQMLNGEEREGVFKNGRCQWRRV